MVEQSPTRPSPVSFGELLRQLRAEAGMTQEELAQNAGLSPRSISDLERNISRTAHRETAELLADAFALSGSVRAAFVAVARGRAPISDVLCALGHAPFCAVAACAHSHARKDANLSPDDIEILDQVVAATTALLLELAACWSEHLAQRVDLSGRGSGRGRRRAPTRQELATAFV